MTELVLANGDIAVATLRTPSALDELTTKYSKDKLLVLKLDVAKPEETKAAFAAALAHFGRIDAVFNNAAYSIFGEAEAMSDAVAREMFDVNLWGAIAVSKEAIRVFREVNQPAGGRLLNVSSSAGIDPVPGLAHYGAAKSGECVMLATMFVSRSHRWAIALIAFTEGLAKEVDPAWNIKVSVQPLLIHRQSIAFLLIVRSADHRCRTRGLLHAGALQDHPNPAAPRLREAVGHHTRALLHGLLPRDAGSREGSRGPLQDCCSARPAGIPAARSGRG